MLIVALPVTFGPDLPALIGRATWRYRFCKLIINSTRVLAEQNDVIDFAYSLLPEQRDVIGGIPLNSIGGLLLLTSLEIESTGIFFPSFFGVLSTP
jgi:hypothetical protein